ncbi:NrfD/PsrC family molybdoenzyme membrane anchor subunit [Kibdelosporangium phytohabitans]|uniref:Polysulfide reductase n=1 Tax=Kibdelosporangium phytohabitans TaxID=860235 RepID=A0A0N7F4G2_9PSEU|nr:NrfD/PsrC family molybdoenzyme membrane anchor subunit [Kibdelosporangium phytohabitans]ALG11343.1 polysulfide reductase [Kibdelosporangium phytohabitans]MBE1462657.1 DMSO reductase anchor subunit [Kibdelosporangium phytohabitans]
MGYYGKPIVKEPVWKVPDVPGYLFLGGMAGASASMALAAQLSGRHELVRPARIAAAVGSLASVGALVHDLGRPERFLNMLRVFKVTSPLSVGSWILAPFSGLTALSATTDFSGRFRGIGTLAGAAAGVLGPAMCTYTSVLLADTAIPAWHNAYPELPFVFAGSAMTSAAGASLLASPSRPAVRLGLLGSALELTSTAAMERRVENYRSSKLLTAAKALTVAGAGLSLLRRNRPAAVLAGVSYLAAGVCTRFGVYRTGVASVTS